MLTVLENREKIFSKNKES